MKLIMITHTNTTNKTTITPSGEINNIMITRSTGRSRHSRIIITMLMITPMTGREQSIFRHSSANADIDSDKIFRPCQGGEAL